MTTEYPPESTETTEEVASGSCPGKFECQDDVTCLDLVKVCVKKMLIMLMMMAMTMIYNDDAGQKFVLPVFNRNFSKLLEFFLTYFGNLLDFFLIYV